MLKLKPSRKRKIEQATKPNRKQPKPTISQIIRQRAAEMKIHRELRRDIRRYNDLLARGSDAVCSARFLVAVKLKEKKR